jgi:hypothetical protein
VNGEKFIVYSTVLPADSFHDHTKSQKVNNRTTVSKTKSLIMKMEKSEDLSEMNYKVDTISSLLTVRTVLRAHCVNDDDGVTN